MLPQLGGLLIAIQSTQRENAKGRNKSDSLNRTPPRTSACSANNLQADHVQTERVAIMWEFSVCFYLVRTEIKEVF